MKAMEHGMKVKRSYSDKIFDVVNIIVMLILLVIFTWPLWFVVIASFSDPNEDGERSAAAEKDYIDSLRRAAQLFFHLDRLQEYDFLYSCRYSGKPGHDGVCGVSTFQKGFRAPQFLNDSFHDNHVFQRRADSHLSGGQ